MEKFISEREYFARLFCFVLFSSGMMKQLIKAVGDHTFLVLVLAVPEVQRREI